MNINWKLRLQNKVTLTSIVVLTVTFVYQILGLFDIVPAISQDVIIQLSGVFINILAGFGVVVDPTTKGASDSEQAMTYTEPKES